MGLFWEMEIYIIISSSCIFSFDALILFSWSA